MAIKMPSSVKPADKDRKAEEFISGAGTPRPIPTPAPAPAAETRATKTVVNMRFDSDVLAKIDAAAKRRGMSRTAWLHMAATAALGVE